MDLLLDGHSLLDDSIREECSFYAGLRSTNERVPFDMIHRSHDASAWYRLKDRTVVTFGITGDKFTREEAEKGAGERYGDVPHTNKGDSLLEKCEKWMQLSKQMLARDGFLGLVFFVESENTVLPLALRPRDRADKHATVRHVADVVAAQRARTVISLGKAWHSEVVLSGSKLPWQYADQDPNRRESIMITGISSTGETVDLHCEFKRTASGIEFGDILSLEGSHSNFMQPIRKAFLKLYPR